MPQFSKEQKRKRELASALFTGVSDPGRRPLKTKTKDRGGQREEKIKQEPPTTTTADLLLDLQVILTCLYLFYHYHIGS